MTVEAAIAIPVYMFFLAFLLFMFRVMTVETIITENLAYTARTIAASGDEENWESKAYGEMLLRLSRSGEISEYVTGGVFGVSLAESYAKSDTIYLIAKTNVRFPIDFFGKKSFTVVSGVSERFWVGCKDEDAESEEYVYITPSGNAYHKTKECKTLDLSIHSVKKADIKDLRNKEGAKYKRCSCVKGENENVYITDYGTQYHGKLSCSDLKRTVMRVHIDEVGSRHPCKKCYK